MDDYVLRRVPVGDTLTDDVRGWSEASSLGFLQADAAEDALGVWHADLLADSTVLTGAYPTSPVPGLPELHPVATYATLEKSLNVGAGRLEPTHLIADVTVRATHRRRGLLRELMTADLAAAAERGTALAALTASEATIYGRYGFGIACPDQTVEIDTGPRFALASPPSGRVEIVDASAAGPLLRATFAAFHARTRGSIDRLAYHDRFLTGTWDYEAGGPSLKTRVAVHHGEDGQPDGHAVYTIEDGPTVRVVDLVAATPAAELELWRFIGSIDLVDKAVYRRFSASSPLRWALADPRVLKTTNVGDFVWLRVLNVPRALGVRGWDADGAVEFEVRDPLGLASGVWRVEVADGAGVVTSIPGAPVTLEARALASLYLGAVDARTLAAAGQIEGPADEIERLARLFAVERPPHCVTAF